MLIILNGCLIESSELKSTYLTSTIGSQYSDCSELAYMLQLYLELAYGVLFTSNKFPMEIITRKVYAPMLPVAYYTRNSPKNQKY